MAGDRIVMSPYSEMMIHDGSGLEVGNAAKMREMADLLDRQSNKIAQIYADRAGGTADAWRALMRAETWFSAQEAVDAGLADEVSAAGAQPTQDRMRLAASWDLSLFHYPNRGSAPSPSVVAMNALRNTATPVHHTDTVSTPWDGGAAERNLPSPVPLGTVRRVFAWYDDSQVTNGAVPKGACKLPHHEVSADGSPGAANLAGVRNALSRLPQSDIPEAQREAVRRHLQAHLDDAPQEPNNSAEWDPAMFKAALHSAAGEFAYDPDTFKAILEHEANNAPAVLSKPAPIVDAGPVFDPTVFQRAVKDATR
jgi:Clp protease